MRPAEGAPIRVPLSLSHRPREPWRRHSKWRSATGNFNLPTEFSVGHPSCNPLISIRPHQTHRGTPHDCFRSVFRAFGSPLRAATRHPLSWPRVTARIAARCSLWGNLLGPRFAGIGPPDRLLPEEPDVLVEVRQEIMRLIAGPLRIVLSAIPAQEAPRAMSEGSGRQRSASAAATSARISAGARIASGTTSWAANGPPAASEVAARTVRQIDLIQLWPATTSEPWPALSHRAHPPRRAVSPRSPAA
jgi:hypothetical protein